jgi:hypothetical protein
LGFVRGKSYNNCFRIGNYYIKDNLAVLVTNSAGLVNVDIIAADSSTSIMSCPAYINTEVGCAFDTTVPDFGTYFGLSPFGASFSTTKSYVCFNYTEAIAKYSSIILNYGALLKKWGFSFKSASANKDCSVSDMYQKSASIVTVTYPYYYSGTKAIKIEVVNVI